MIMPREDEQGRFPLTGNEYYAIRQLFGVLSGFATCMSYIEKRAKTKKGVWRDLRMIETVSERVLGEILRTVPAKKLQHIYKELDNTVVTVEVKGPKNLPMQKTDMFCYCPEESVETLARSTIEMQCFGCTKTPKEAKKCPYKIALDNCVPYEIGGDSETLCKFADTNFDALMQSHKKE